MFIRRCVSELGIKTIQSMNEDDKVSGVKCDLSMSVYHLVWKIFSLLSFLVVLTELGILITFLDFRSHYLSIIRLDELIRGNYINYSWNLKGESIQENNKTVSSLSPL